MEVVSLLIFFLVLELEPTGRFDYRIRIFEKGCIVVQIKGDWRGGIGSYDAELNKVIFPIPPEWSPHHIRLENRIKTPNQTSRA